MCKCVYATCVQVSTKTQKEALDPLDLGLQAYESPTVVLGASPRHLQGQQELLTTDLSLQTLLPLPYQIADYKYFLSCFCLSLYFLELKHEGFNADDA